MKLFLRFDKQLLVILLVLIPFFTVSICESLAEEQKDNSEYVIGPGDLLEIMVWKEPELSRIYSVRIDGRISVPLLGDIKASGETISGLMNILEGKFKEVVTEPTVTVILNESRSWRYYIIGLVNQSGEYIIDSPISVVQALAKSGGFREWAQTDRIKVIRIGKTGKDVITFDFKALSEKNDLSQDIMLRPGDTILVP